MVAFNRDDDDEPVPYDDGYGDESFRVITQVVHVPDHGAIGYNSGFQNGLNRGESRVAWISHMALLTGLAVGIVLGLAVAKVLFGESL